MTISNQTLAGRSAQKLGFDRYDRLEDSNQANACQPEGARVGEAGMIIETLSMIMAGLSGDIAALSDRLSWCLAGEQDCKAEAPMVRAYENPQSSLGNALHERVLHLESLRRAVQDITDRVRL